VLAGCPGNLDPALQAQGGTGGSGNMGSGGANGSCAQTVITTNCAMAACHSSIVKFAGLNLSSWPIDPATIVGVKPQDGSGSTCTSENFLDGSSSPATGLIIENLQDSTLKCGVRMPYQLPALSASDVACLQAWANDLVAGR